MQSSEYPSMRRGISDLRNSQMHFSMRESLPKVKGDKAIQKLKTILKKPIQARNHADSNFLTEFINSNIYLTDLAEKNSIDFVKNLFKSATILQLPMNKIITQQNNVIPSLFVLLDGCAAAMKRSEEFITDLQEENTIERLITKAVSFIKQMKRKSKNPSSTLSKIVSDEIPYAFEDYGKEIDRDEIQKYYHSQEPCGMYDLSVGETFLHTTVTTEQTTLLAIPKNHLMTCLEQAFKQKTKTLIQCLKAIPCFGILETEKLKSVIQSLVLKKRKRGDAIYSQGNSSASVYFLSKGQVKITKETNLFMENPNSLYIDRVQLLNDLYKKDEKHQDRQEMLQTERKKKKAVLRYADLTTLYNYRPMKKMLQIGVLSPFCIFGEEQHVEGRDRQTNAFCSSLDVEYYEIQMKKLKEIVSQKYLAAFMKVLKNSIRKKVLYRQNQYATNINFQNKNNMDYFYYDGDEEKESPRKVKIEKLNDKIQQKNSKEKKVNVPAFYTSFNFHKLVGKNKEKKVEKTQISQTESKQDPTERHLMDISHTWKVMEKKVHSEIKRSKKISQRKHVINLKMPLIQAEYFYNVDKEKRRIERDFRKRVLSLGKKKKGMSMELNDGI